jgi:hypothetical protein
LHFRPDGKLYVLSRNAHNVRRFDATTGAFMDVFIPANSGGLQSTKGMTVGPDGNWYVSSGTSEILRYNGTTGAFLGVFVAAGSGGLNTPRGLAIGPDGNMYTSSQGSHAVLRFDGQTGAFMGAIVPPGSGGLNAPGELLFHGGSLYVASQGTNQVLRYNAQTGAFLEVAVPAGQNGLDRPLGLLLDPDNNLLVGSYAEILRYGPASQAAFTVRLDAPSATPVTVNYATAPGTALAGSDFTATAGTLTFAPGQTTRTILVRTLDDTLSEGSETFVVNLSNPVGATIADAQAVGTIADNEPSLLQVAAVAVNGGASQRSRVTEVTVTFNTVVTFAGGPANAAAAFRLTRTGPGTPAGDVTLAVDLSGSTAARTVARLTFSGPLTEFGSLIDGRYTLTVLSAQVSAGGQPLDGDGDGVAGGDAVSLLHRLYGDVTGDGTVNGADFNPFRLAFGAGPGNPSYVAALDFDGDGFVIGADFNEFRRRFGSSI